MPRFVVLEHDYPELHYDFMLETPAGLLTWRLSRLPHTPSNESYELPAVPLAMHRAVYLDYEGPISDHRGTVQRRIRGDFTWLEQASSSSWSIQLHSSQLVAVLRCAGDQRFQFHPVPGTDPSQSTPV